MTRFIGDSRAPASVRSRALTSVALSAATLALLVPGMAGAQQAAEIQEVTVTGSRIKAPNLTSESPVSAVTQDEIKLQGTTNIEEMLNTLPEMHAAQGNFTSNGSTGVANLDISGLGPTRTLVLIDGRRIGPGNPSSFTGTAADVNFIPQALISSVDVMKGGGSAVYGSDAVAGVVNFHLMRNFEGVMFDEVYSMAQHDSHSWFDTVERAQPLSPPINVPTGSQFDGFVRDSTLVVGSNSPDNKGNVAIYLEYRSTTPVLQGTRDWGVCPAGTNRTVLNCSGFSSTDAYGRFQAANGVTYALNPNGTATFVPFNLATQGYNFSPINYLQRQDDRSSLGALGHYEIKPWLDVYTEVMFMEDKSQAQIAPAGIFFSSGPANGAQLTLPCNYPYLSAAQEAQLCVTKTGQVLPTSAVITLNPSPGLRFASFPRETNYDHEDYRAVAGFRGDIDGNWSYDLSASYWDTQLSQTTLNYISFNALQAALNCTPGTSGCVQPNIFQYNALTPTMVNAIGTAALTDSFAREMTAGFNITGDLGPYGGKSPFAKNPIGVAFGAEYRSDNLNVQPDNEQKVGDLLGAGGAVPAVNGSEDVKELYAEARIPLVENMDFVKSANIDLAIRHSDYGVYNSGNGFSTNTWKLTADYAPDDNLRFRGGYNRAARAPNIYELLYPNTVGLYSGNDPCGGPTPQASAAACALTGVSAAQYGHINQCVSNQCESQTGGSSALKPEEADTWTWGANYTPTYVPGLAVSVDYWDVRVAQYISPLPANGVTQGCLLYNITSLCSLIHRDINGTIASPTGYVATTYTNFGDVHNRGIDFDASYRKDLSALGFDGYGAVTLKFNGTYAIENSISTLQSYNCAGLYGNVCGGATTVDPDFTWRHVARLSWDMPWDAQFAITWRYLSPVKLDTNNSQVGLSNGVYDAADAKIHAFNYIDLSAAWKIWNRYTIRAGVSNLFDKDPPIISQSAFNSTAGGTNGNTYTGTYDPLGRVIFTSFNAKF
jgi:iron complex outermembrane receptor protein